MQALHFQKSLPTTIVVNIEY